MEMQVTLAHIGSRPAASDAYEALTRTYVQRTAPYFPMETVAFRGEEAWAAWLEKQGGRSPVWPVLLDSRGKPLSSEELARWLGMRRDEGTRHIVFAIGPANGWSEDSKGRARLLLSLGPLTLAHMLARLVVAEQVYRAGTILAGHPYHTGH